MKQISILVSTLPYRKYLIDFTPEEIKAWFEYQLNRTWGVNIDIRHIDNALLVRFNKVDPAASQYLYWSFKPPYVPNGLAYDCTVVYGANFDTLVIRFI